MGSAPSVSLAGSNPLERRLIWLMALVSVVFLHSTLFCKSVLEKTVQDSLSFWKHSGVLEFFRNFLLFLLRFRWRRLLRTSERNFLPDFRALVLFSETVLIPSQLLFRSFICVPSASFLSFNSSSEARITLLLRRRFLPPLAPFWWEIAKGWKWKNEIVKLHFWTTVLQKLY